MVAPQRFHFGLSVWRVMLDAFSTAQTENLLVLELRNQTKVEWCALDVNTSQIVWQHTLPNTSWWTSLIGFYSGVILFHTYESSEQPAPKQLLAVDAFSGAQLWALDDCKFESTDGHYIKTSRIDATLTLQFNFYQLADGKNTMLYSLEERKVDSFWKTPVLHQTSSPYFLDLCRFVENRTGEKPQKVIKYGEIAKHILFFQYLYTTNAITLSHFILVVNSSKKVLWHEMIDSDINTSLFAGCLYNDHCIVYLKNLSELVVLKLPRP